MPRQRNTPPRCHKTLLALAAGAALAPCGAWAIDLAQSPPGSVEPYIRPNVIISIDDSGSMNYRLDSESTSGANNRTTPDLAGGGWSMNSRRMNVLKYTLRGIFDPADPNYDATLLPDKKIRIAWQALHNNGSAQSAGSVDSTSLNTNSMQILQGQHRTDLLTFINSLKPNGGTPSHLMLSQADNYMRRPLSQDGPWASVPGTTGEPYLACRRTYHIYMTDGRWNGTATAIPDTSKRDNATNLPLWDGTVYGGATSAERAKSALYRDTSTGTTLADWAFYSWATPLQTSGLTGTMQAAADYRKAGATETFPNTQPGGSAVTLDRFWNPRYNPATWPHMVTYTIGFSAMAYQWDYTSIVRPTQMLPFGYDGSFANLANGTVSWPNLTSSTESRNALDLWHAALNGRGRFYAVEKGEDLAKAFRDIFGQINTQTDPDLTSSATSGSNSTRYDVGRYTASYEPQNNWKGSIKSEVFKTDDTIVANPAWNNQTTADKLDAAGFSVANRLVLSFSDKMDTAGKLQGGVPFQWASDESRLSTAQKQKLLASVSNTNEGTPNGANRLDYIRGDRSLEGSDTSGYTNAKPYRERKSRQGDIINSVVWYTGAPSSNYALRGYTAFTRANKGRTPMIYAGGNDGMLHGFSAADGTEKIAYVPKGVISNLPYLTSPTYNNNHKSFVDGSPMTGDVDMGVGVQDPDDPSYDPAYIPDWRTLLVGTLGAGGRGFFVLDVTNPDGNGSTPAFSETNASTLVVMDRTRDAGNTVPDCTTGLNSAQQAACSVEWEQAKDIGHITAQPVVDDANPMVSTQITRLNNNRWAVVLGNGYNSINQRPVLLIQYLDGAKELLRLPVTNDAAGTGNAADNGLSAPRLVDLNGDSRPDLVYAGDNLGNLWKFDLTNLDDAQWKVAFGGTADVNTPDDGLRGDPASAKPLFTALGPASLGSASRTKIQPITAAPTVRANDRMKTIGTGANAKTVAVGGMMVAFGTGRNVAKTDEASVDVQTLYSVLDNTRYKVVDTTKGKRLEVHPGGGTCPGGADCVPTPAALGTGVTNAKLAEQKITEVDGGAFGTVDVVDELKNDTWDSMNGWYMDFPAVGERALKPMSFFDGSNLLTVFSQVPAKGSNVDPNIESCESTSVDAERQYRTLINIMDGKRPTVQIVDYNGDGVYNLGSDQGISRKQVGKGAHNLVAKGDKVIDVDVKNNKELLARMPEQSLRPSWRQLK